MSSTGSREARARAALDKAEKIIIEKFMQFNLSENSKDNLENIRKMLNSASSGYSIAENFTDIPEKILKSKARAIVLFAETATGNVLIDSTMGESKMKQIVGTLRDAIIAGGALLTPQGWIITGANLALSLVDWDLGSVFKKIYGDDDENIRITPNGFIEVANDDGSIYIKPLSVEARRILNISIEPSGSTFGDTKDDVLFGGNGNDMLIGHGGKDILIGGNGKDDYFVDNGDIIKDSDGNGRVFLENHQLTGGTQIEKGSQIYKGKDGTKYELKGSDLIINDSITIENFSKISNDLDIVLVDIDDIVVTMGNNQSTEGGNGKHSMEFKITLNRALKKDEFLELIINGQRIKFKEGDIEQTYTHTWDGNTIKEEDRKFEVSGIVMQTSENLNVQAVVSGQGLIKDDDKDPNDDKPETYDPLAIDLNNDGIKGTNLDYKINFDLDNNGFKEATSWIDNNDAFIAIDKNNNGAIDNGSELFGNKSISNNAYAYTNPNAKNGFEALSEFDSNNDGIIDINDEKFANLNLLVA